MPRNSSGTYALPGSPVVSGQVISSALENAYRADVSAELTDSYSRSDKGPLLARLRNVDGSAASPAITFNSETNTGWYRAAAGDLRLAIGGVDLISFKNNTITLLVGPNPQILATGSNTAISILGNRNAADVNPDTVIGSTAVRTAGLLTYFQNGGTNKLGVDYQGLLSLVSQAAPLQPASMVTAITPNAGITAGGCAYWKDATGVVRLEGAVTNASGGNVTNIASTTPLPAGFRPPATGATMVAQSTVGPVQVAVSTAGVITTAPVLANGNQLFFDGLSFRAAQ